MDKKILEVLTSPPDAALSIVSQGPDGPHLVNSWNSYAITLDNRLLLPAGRMVKTEENLKNNPQVLLSIANREVEGKSYKGTGFLVKGLASFESQGNYFDMIKEKFPWARAALVIEITELEQTL